MPHLFLWLHVFILHEAIGNVLAYLFTPIVCLSKVSFLSYWQDQTLIITPGSANLEFWRKKQNKQKKTKKKTRKKKQTRKSIKLADFIVPEQISSPCWHWSVYTLQSFTFIIVFFREILDWAPIFYKKKELYCALASEKKSKIVSEYDQEIQQSQTADNSWQYPTGICL